MHCRACSRLFSTHSGKQCLPYTPDHVAAAKCKGHAQIELTFAQMAVPSQVPTASRAATARPPTVAATAVASRRSPTPRSAAHASHIVHVLVCTVWRVLVQVYGA